MLLGHKQDKNQPFFQFRNLVNQDGKSKTRKSLQLPVSKLPCACRVSKRAFVQNLSLKPSLIVMELANRRSTCSYERFRSDTRFDTGKGKLQNALFLTRTYMSRKPL